MLFSPASFYFLLRYKYFPQHPAYDSVIGSLYQEWDIFPIVVRNFLVLQGMKL